MIEEIARNYQYLEKEYNTANNVFEHLVTTNDPLYNYNKLVEELFELGEVLSKKINKDGTDKEPSKEKLVEEMGDVYLRLDILATKLNIIDDIKKRIVIKLSDKFAGYINEGKYIGRI